MHPQSTHFSASLPTVVVVGQSSLTWMTSCSPNWLLPHHPCFLPFILPTADRMILYTYISSVQLLGCVRLFVTPWTPEARQASLSIKSSQSLLKLISIESVMPSNHLVLCCPLLLLPSVFPSIRVFSSESVFRIMWPKYWSFSFSRSPSNEYSGLISFRMDWLILLEVQVSRVFSSTTVQKHQFFGTQLSLWSNSHIHT